VKKSISFFLPLPPAIWTRIIACSAQISDSRLRRGLIYSSRYCIVRQIVISVLVARARRRGIECKNRRERATGGGTPIDFLSSSPRESLIESMTTATLVRANPAIYGGGKTRHCDICLSSLESLSRICFNSLRATVRSVFSPFERSILLENARASVTNERTRSSIYPRFTVFFRCSSRHSYSSAISVRAAFKLHTGTQCGQRLTRLTR